MAGSNDIDIWTQFVDAIYLDKARTYPKGAKCPTCNSPKDCNNYYCLHCKVGGLCPIKFRQNGQHLNHPWVQVRRQTKHNAVAAKDLERFIASANHIYTASQNSDDLCYLECRIRPSSAAGPSSSIDRRPKASKTCLKRCESCTYAIPNSEFSRKDFLVCSVLCLGRMAQSRPNLNLLRMRNGAMDPMPWPQTANEKLSKGTSASTALVVVPELQVVVAPPMAPTERPEINATGNEPARATRKRGRPVKAEAESAGPSGKVVVVERAIDRFGDGDGECRRRRRVQTIEDSNPLPVALERGEASGAGSSEMDAEGNLDRLASAYPPDHEWPLGIQLLFEVFLKKGKVKMHVDGDDKMNVTDGESGV